MAPRHGHLTAAIRMFGYIRTHADYKIIVDPRYRDTSSFQPVKQDWKRHYPDAEEDLPRGVPDPKGRPMRVTCYVDADHATDVVTRRSVTGIIIFLNDMPVRFVSKQQKCCATSTYGAELIAARQATEMILEPVSYTHLTLPTILLV